MQASKKQSEQEIETECSECCKVFKRKLTEREIDYGQDRFRSYFCSETCSQESKVKAKESEEMEKERYTKTNIKLVIPKKFIEVESGIQNIDDLMNKSVFITGSAGVGKTVLMASLIKKYIRQGKSVKWISYPEFIMTLQGMFRNNDQNPYEYAEQVANFDGVLAIDDLGAEKITEFVRQITYYIINQREQNMLKMIITSNYNLKEIDEMIDGRISSRIAGTCEIKKLEGKDRRIK